MGVRRRGSVAGDSNQAAREVAAHGAKGGSVGRRRLRTRERRVRGGGPHQRAWRPAQRMKAAVTTGDAEARTADGDT
jgi:hypothetical protein